MSQCVECGTINCLKHSLVCTQCGKSYVNRERYYIHTQKCKRSSRQKILENDVANDYKAHIQQLNEYYETAIQQLYADYQHEKSQLQSTIDALTVSHDNIKNDAAHSIKKLHQEYRDKIFELDKRNRDLIDRLQSSAIRTAVDESEKTRYNKEIEQLKQDLIDLKSQNQTEIQNIHQSTYKKTNEIEHKHKLQLEESKTQYVTQIAALEKALSEQKVSLDSKANADMQKATSLHNRAINDLKSMYEEKQAQYEAEIKRIASEKDTEIQSTLAKYKNIKYDFEFTSSKLKDLNTKLMEADTNHDETIRKMRAEHEKESRDQTNDILSLRAQIKLANHINDTLTEELKQVKLERNALEEKTNIEHSTLRHRVAQYQINSEKAQDNYRAKEEELSLKYQNQLSTQLKQIMELQNQCDEYTVVKENYSTGLKTIEKLRLQARDMATKIKEQEDTIHILRQTKVTDSDKYKETVHALQEIRPKLVLLTQHVKSLDEEKKSLLVAMRTQTEQYDDLEQKYVDVQDKYHRVLQSTSMTIRDEKELVQYLKAELARLTMELEKLNPLCDTIRLHESTIAKQGHEIDKVMHILERKQSDYAQLSTNYDDLMEKYTTNTDKMNAYIKMSQNYESKMSQLHNQLEKVQSIHDRLAQDYQTKVDEHNTVKNARDQIERELVVCRNKLSSQASELATTISERDSVAKKYIELKAINDQIAQTTNQLKKECDVSNGKCISLADQTSALRKENDKLRKEFDEIYKLNEATTSSLSSKLQACTRELKSAKEQNKEYEMALTEVRETEKMVKEYKSKLVMVETDYSILQSNSEKIIRKFRSELDTSTTQIDILRDRIKIVETENNRLQPYEDKCKLLETENQRYQQDCHELMECRCKIIDMERVLGKTKNAYQTLLSKHDQLVNDKTDLTRVHKECNELKSSLSTLKNTHVDTTRQLDSIKNLNDKLQQSINARMKEIATLRKDIANRVKIENEYRDTIHTLKTKYKEEGHSLSLRLAKYDTQYKKMEKDCAVSQEKLSMCEETQRKTKEQYDDVSKQLKQHIIFSDTLQLELENTKQELQRAKQVRDSCETCATLLIANNILSKENNTIKINSKRDLEIVHQEVKDLKHKLQASIAECGTYRQKCTDLEHSIHISGEKIKSLDAAIFTIQRTNTELQKQLSTLPSLAEIQKHEKIYDEIKVENATLQKRLNALQPQLRTLDKLKNNDREQRLDIQEKTHTIIELTRTINTLKSQLQEYTSIHHTLRDELKSMQNTIRPLEDTIAQQGEEIERLKELPKRLDKKVIHLRNESLKTIHKYIDTEKQIRDLYTAEKEQNQQLQLLVESLTIELTQLNADMEHLVQMKEDLKNSFQSSLNEQKSNGAIQIQEMQKLTEARDIRIRELEQLVNTYIIKQMNNIV